MGHTTLIGKLGPLEWILNTPSHHRVHHGSNKYCLDKNFGGWLIIWDRMFGTFQEEIPDVPIVYGLVDQVKSFNPFYLQVFYYKKLHEKWQSMDGWKNKIYSLVWAVICSHKLYQRAVNAVCSCRIFSKKSVFNMIID